jgi:peptidoglycan/LPS O-acetylase OafA/YrhL
VGPLRWRFQQWRWCLVAGVIGAAVSSIGLLVGPLSGDMGRASPGMMLVFPGFVAGVLAARVFGVRATYPPPPMPPLPQRAGIGESP